MSTVKTAIVPPPAAVPKSARAPITYRDAIREGFQYLFRRYPKVFALGQGLWSPWYVGGTMTGLDQEFGRERIMDSPVSELAVTGAGIGAALLGYRPIVIHPRIDFMLLAVDQIVTQMAKWSSMFGGRQRCPITVRGIVNRGGEQGAQHSQALHAWFAHIPGLRVVMPATVADARDLLIASVLCDDPVLYIDDNWLYTTEVPALPPPVELDLRSIEPQVLLEGQDVTLVGCSYSVSESLRAAQILAQDGISAEVIDLRVLNPFRPSNVVRSVKRTGRLCVVDGGWKTCGMAGEVIAAVSESVSPSTYRATPLRITLPDAPAPTSGPLEKTYYGDISRIVSAVKSLVKGA
jgi:acetoin:2,6-dichlorophenolindophenol oxidoreductase subunit beta